MCLADNCKAESKRQASNESEKLTFDSLAAWGKQISRRCRDKRR